MRTKQPFLKRTWCFTHRANLLAKYALNRLGFVAEHFRQQGVLYSIFSEKNMRQLYQGMCRAEALDYLAIKKDSQSRFNSQLLPTINIGKQFLPLLLSLRHKNRKDKDCIEYRNRAHDF